MYVLTLLEQSNCSFGWTNKDVLVQQIFTLISRSNGEFRENRRIEIDTSRGGVHQFQTVVFTFLDPCR